MPSELPGSPGGRTGVDAGGAQGREEARGPTFSSASTAGTFSDCCSARRTVTAPWWSRSKLRGSQSLEAHRHVLDQRVGMQRAVVEGHGIDQRLQRRAGRAVGAHQIDLAGAAEEVAAAQPGHDAAGAVVDHDHGDLRLVGPSGRARRRRAGPGPTGARSASWSARPCPATGRRARPRDAARSSASPAGAPGTGRLIAMSYSALVDRRRAPGRAPARGRGRPAPRRRRGRAGGARRLRDGDQQGRFGGAELLRLLAEIGEGGRAHALEIAAHRRQGEVDRQHLALGVAPFELQRRAPPGSPW